MQPQITQVMFTALNSVFEEAAYAVLEELGGKSLPPWGEPPMVIRLPFTGACFGEMWLATSSDYARELTGSILGLDEEDSLCVEKGAAVLMELLNMVGGRLLADLFGASGAYEMGLPERLKLQVEEYSGILSTATEKLHTTDYFGSRVDFLLSYKQEE